MSHFVHDRILRLNVTESDGLLMIITMGFSLRGRDMYFELHKLGERYKLYWRPEANGVEVVNYIKENGLKGISFEEAFNHPDIMEFCRNFPGQGSAMLEAGEEVSFLSIINEGLPGKKVVHSGLDGCGCEIWVIGDPDIYYKCWGCLPRGWGAICQVIDVLRKHAGLGEKYDFFYWVKAGEN